MINAYYNGSFSSIEEIRIPLTDRCIYFGDGVYDAMVGRDGKIHLFEKHIERLSKRRRVFSLKLHALSSCMKTIYT